MRRVHAVVTGRVQGVFYRDSARQEAERLGVTGWVRNLPDGRVELVAEGLDDAVSGFLEWCRQGPAAARVEKLDVEDEEPDLATHGFEVLP